MKWWLFGLLMVSVPAFGQLQVAELFADNMVLQRGQPIPIWGKGQPGAELEIRFGNIIRQASVGSDSAWRIVLKAMPANRSPQELEVTTGSERILRRNILVGDLWLCTGQSNMEWTFSRDASFEDELPGTNQPLIRLYNTSFAGKYVYGTAYSDSILAQLNPASFYSGSWENCTEQTVLPMSAVAYYFAQKVTEQTDVPVGLINLAIGGAPIETFIDPGLLATHPEFQSKTTGNWLVNQYLPAWVRERALQNLGVASLQEQYPAHAYKPGFAFSAAIPRWSQLPIAGILFYQGESNSLEPDRVQEYGRLLQLLVQSFRDSWKNPALPFYYAQLSSIDTPHYKADYWPLFRDIQRTQMDSIPNSGMAVTSDVGHPRDVHPRDKRTVGYRLAAWALYHQYGKKDQVFSGPKLRSIAVKRNHLVLRFQHSAGGLRTSDGKALRGFSFDGKTPVNAVLRKTKLKLPYTVLPNHLYYGWAPWSTANLVNGAGLPASTFSQKISVL